MAGLLTFTTDFGADSHYVAQMKAAALRVAPDVRLLDITHSIGPQDVDWGAVVLEDCLPHFAPGTVHVAVVDPGVGTDRAIVAADLDGRLVVAPDNGLLARVMRRLPVREAVRVEWAPPRVSRTFHGRDIMAPAAARLASGATLADLGSAWTPHSPPLAEPRLDGNVLHGEVVLVDAFGNLLTNLLAHLWDSPPDEVRCAGHRVLGVRETYGRQAGELIALIGSSGRLELAEVQGNAATRLQLQRGAVVEAVWHDAPPAAPLA